MAQMIADCGHVDFSGWSNGWEAIASVASADYFAQALARDICENKRHLLFGKRVKFIARNSASDDFIAVIESTEQFVHIHLTFRQETDSKWPYTEVLGNEPGLKKFLDEWSD